MIHGGSFSVFAIAPSVIAVIKLISISREVDCCIEYFLAKAGNGERDDY